MSNLLRIANLGDIAVVVIDRNGIHCGEVTMVSRRGIDITNQELGTKFIKWYNVRKIIKEDGEEYDSWYT